MRTLLFFCISYVGLLQASPFSVTSGGTGNSSMTAYAVICGGTSSVTALQSIASLGSSGQLLTSNGTSALPTFNTWAEYGHVYTYAGSTITAGSAYLFDLNGSLSSNISHSTSSNTDQITINKTGVYLFVYIVHGYDQDTYAGISVNGTLDTSTTFYYGTAFTIVILCGFCILNITSGDVVRMINPDASATTYLDTSFGSITASLVITQIA